jgi:hypothetical protein
LNRLSQTYFFDEQVAAALGITVGTLRNRVATKEGRKAAGRGKCKVGESVTDIPEYGYFLKRVRIFEKEKVKAYLERNVPADQVAGMMADAESAKPMLIDLPAARTKRPTAKRPGATKQPAKRKSSRSGRNAAQSL